MSRKHRRDHAAHAEAADADAPHVPGKQTHTQQLPTARDFANSEIDADRPPTAAPAAPAGTSPTIEADIIDIQGRGDDTRLVVMRPSHGYTRATLVGSDGHIIGPADFEEKQAHATVLRTHTSIATIEDRNAHVRFEP